jgi:LacI family transcriptional regulator
LTAPAGIRDVAALAGVSPGTASKALNGTGQLREATRERVRAAARELGFEPNPLARSLLSGRTYTVGIVTTDHSGRFSIPLMRGAEDVLGEGELAAFLCDSRGDPVRERRYVRLLLSRRVDGIIVAGRRTDPRPPLAAGLPVPVVYAYNPSLDPADCSVVADEAGGIRDAVEHLLATGRRRIAHVTGPAGHHAASVRAAAFTAALAAHGSEPAVAVRFGEWSEAWGRLAVRDLPEVDAVLCGSDQIARGAAEELRATGRRVPADVALVGVDNWRVFSQASRPPLTSVDLNLEAIGRRAGELLLAAIAGRPSPGVHALPCRLVIRESSAPAGG